MTWIIGVSTIFGYGVVISDVQVTFKDGTTADILQKAYPLSNFIVGGFAGSVRIGCMLLQSLYEYLEIPTGQEKTHAWHPLWVANTWGPLAKKLFDNAPYEERKLGSRILLVAASPTEKCGLGAKIYFIRFADPTFVPGIMARAIKICGIGSGAGIIEYKQKLNPLLRIRSGILRAEVGVSGGWGTALAYAVSHVLHDDRRKGISRHLNIFEVRGGAIYESNNDETIHPSIGQAVEIRMPNIARGYSEFGQMVNSIGKERAEAVC